jgi:Phytanoyl-CoA dioxygenase (PhyH)
MPSIDKRTRFVGDEVELDASWLFDDLPAILRDTGALGARGVQVLGLSTLGFDVDGATAHLAVDDGKLVVREGDADDGPIAILDANAFSELMQDITSTFGLTLPGRVQFRRGGADDFTAWEPVLRAVLDERPVYEPGSIEFCARDGSPLDVRQSFRVDDPREDVGHFLAEAGYLHLQGVFTKDEMAAVSAELSDAVAAATQDDGSSWWARNDDGWFASRILGFNLQSPTLRQLLDSDRFRTIGTLTDDETVQRNPYEGDSAEGLDKKPGVVEGISDVSWHKDCSLGGHSRRCCGMTVGISVTGADRESGELGVIPGSHRANVQQVNVRADFDLERVALPTRTGDVTVHCSCTLHMSRPPVSRGRRVVYTGFGLAPRTQDVVATLSPEEIRRNRAALNDQTRNLQRRADFGVDVETFELESTT